MTSPTSGKLAAATAKQVIILTVGGAAATALSENTVTSVQLGGDATCATVDSYVVTNATTLTVKTPTNGCPASPGGTAEAIRINFAGGDYIEKLSAITFVSPAALPLAATKPVTTENSLALGTADKVTRFHTTGGQIVRVVADSTYTFDPRTSAGLAVTFSGKAGTEIKVYDTATSTTPLANTVAASGPGNALTFKTAAGMSTTDKTLTITQGGVSKTFSATDTGVTAIAAAPIVTGVVPNSARIGAGTTVVVSGTGFEKDASKYNNTVKVKFCGVDAASYGTTAVPAAVNTAGTQITAVVPAGLGNVSPGLGTGNYAGTCAVQVVDTTAGTESPITAASTIALVKE
ncbi:MAG TPA: IPT/TIG domain-containing protein [Actinoplanes sp.]|nr:IPT/TIG domain-containing protein [Actinoplanes sp.]